MMKTTTTTIFALLCMCSIPAPTVMARRLNDSSEFYIVDLSESETDDKYDDDYLPSETDDPTDDDQYGYDYKNDQTGSVQYGYDYAKDMWGNGAYDCKRITSDYWYDVQDELFPECDKQWSSYSQDCKSGCEKFTLEQMGNCFDVQDCSDVGLSASSSVVGSFCKRETLYHDIGWLPAKCRLHAETSCKSDAVNMIQEFTIGGVCSTVVTRSSLDYVDEIHKLCEEQVYEMEQAAILIWDEYYG